MDMHLTNKNRCLVSGGEQRDANDRGKTEYCSIDKPKEVHNHMYVSFWVFFSKS